MYGDVTSGDTTHQDVVLSYQSHFTVAHRNLPKILNVPTKEAKFEAWTETSEIVEVIKVYDYYMCVILIK